MDTAASLFLFATPHPPRIPHKGMLRDAEESVSLPSAEGGGMLSYVLIPSPHDGTLSGKHVTGDGVRFTPSFMGRLPGFWRAPNDGMQRMQG
ncbi:hypothetical protein NPIL_223231 [Nephila pilipes]|uniref:Uncharacterized protein n=1 Tax=Nephila pilipes TaxID=299642 RepID=A0A8X6IR89_NEPPI|nr:hypothetical protein NPIL_223231 [Nephila pilipes]